MGVTITLGDATLLIIGIGLIVFIFYLIAMVKNLLPSLKSLSKILGDMETVSAAAADGAEGAKKIVNDVSTVVDEVAGVVKGNQSSVKAATNLINAVSSLAKLINKKDEK